MRRHLRIVCTAVVVAGALIAGAAVSVRAHPPVRSRHASSPAASCRPPRYRAGSPPSGAFLSAAERATAAANGVRGPASGPYLAEQPVQGFSSMVPADAGTWWALADNGFAWRGNSADFQLVFYRLDPRWGDPAGPRVLETVVLRDPDRRIPWTIVCDQESGTPSARLLLQRAAPRTAGVRLRAGGPHPDRLRPRPGVVRAGSRRHVLGQRGVRSVPRPRRGRRPGAGAAGPVPRRPLAAEPVPEDLGPGARRAADAGRQPRPRGPGDQPGRLEALRAARRSGGRGRPPGPAHLRLRGREARVRRRVPQAAPRDAEPDGEPRRASRTPRAPGSTRTPSRRRPARSRSGS